MTFYQVLTAAWPALAAAGADAGAMRKLVTLTLAVLLVGLFAAVVFAAVDAGDGSTVSTAGTTDTTETTDDDRNDRPPTTADGAAGDISGPCDEAEHANDPRCTGVDAPADAQRRRRPQERRGHLRPLRRGRARERPALHRRRGASSRTTAVAATAIDRGGDDGDDDNSGPGSGDDDDDDDDSSGHGGGDGDDDGGNSGHGGGDDD